jgi:putative oxidoreductase
MHSILTRFVRLENAIHRQLVGHSLTALRVAVGAVFLGFGFLKFFPGVSPAENLVKATTDLLTFGLVPGGVALVAVASLESFIGICLILGRWMRLAIWLLAVQFVGILSPLVLLTGRLFAGPHHAPTLEGQYVLKDVILAAAGMVIAAATFRGGRLVRDEPAFVPPAVARSETDLDAAGRLQVVLEGVRDDRSVEELCRIHGISEAAYYGWRDQVIDGARRALDEHHPATV